MIKQIVLDTNFLLIPGEFNVDIFSEIERICSFNYSLVVLDVVMGELDKLIEKGGKEKKNSKLALTLINQKNVNIVKSIDSGISVDDVIVGYAQKNQCVVATQDLGLAGKLKLSKIPRILLRKKQFLVIETFK
tara:strand:+ start:60 stop:458 length:399 start_codon:yes stop_codon:yes gene_type:complete